MIIAIDGPAGSGKSTIARNVAKTLDYFYLDTGAMYRALTWKTIKYNIDVSNIKTLAELAATTEISFKIENGEEKVFIDRQDVTNAIRAPEVTSLVSIVSKIVEVRKAMVDKQRRFSRGKNLVAEGRDIGTVVFPNADLKIYLNASLQERAHRRQLQLSEKGHSISLDELKIDINKRDHIDSTREEGPLLKAEDAMEIDNSDKTVRQVTEEVIELVRGKTTV